jgi:hypothetical protein
VSKHRSPTHDATFEEDRKHDEPVIGMADRRATGIGVGGEEDVALFDRAFKVTEEVGDGKTELANHHLAFGVTDQGEFVVLLTDTWRECGAEEHLVHFVACVAKGVLNKVEGDDVNVNLLERTGCGFNNACHGDEPLLG